MATKKQSLTVPVADKAKQGCACGCAPCEGTCCRLDCIVQPRFFCGQLLTDADLSAMLKWARDRFGLSRYRHGWGVVCGLDVRARYASPTTIVVTPGYAVDCCGNDVIVCEDATVDLRRVCRDEQDPCADLRRQLGLGGETRALRDRVRAVDVYLQYNEESADPTTAMGRGSCKQVSECEYSRTKETYKVTAELAVAGSDPVRARAMQWQEGYEKCLDVLKAFRAQFPQGGQAEDVRQWLLKWLDEHPEHGLSFMRGWLAGVDKGFFGIEQNLVAVLFVFVQVCRNAYLNCECFGCDEDTRLPLARVWVLPEDRATNQACTVVAVDAYPPYRRPVQPDCWPAPLGSVNVGRFIWHRWPEVCSAASDLGLNIERTPFTLPANLRDLQDALTCDLFVGCDERRFAYVLNADTVAGFNFGIELFGERVVGFCQTPPRAEPGPEPSPCPDIRIDHPTKVGSGQPITFAVTLIPPVPDAVYDWQVSHGVITSGQSTARLTVDPGDMIGSLTASAEIKGLPENCPNRVSGTVEVSGPEFDTQPTEPLSNDFTQISGIGAARATALQNAGIRTFAQLANTPMAKLKELFPPSVTEDVLNEWLQKAKELAG